jgi:hypothetical protein
MKPLIRIEEEYGYRNWIWMPDMTDEEVIGWWKALPTVGAFFYDGPKDLPGEIFQVYFDWEDQDNEKFCLIKEGEGREVYQTSEFIDVPEGAWYMHMHTDNDSVLIIDNDERIYHAGHVTDEEFYSELYEPSKEAQEICDQATAGQIKKVLKAEYGSEEAMLEAMAGQVTKVLKTDYKSE